MLKFLLQAVAILLSVKIHQSAAFVPFSASLISKSSNGPVFGSLRHKSIGSAPVSRSSISSSIALRMAAGGPSATESLLSHPLAAILSGCKDFGLVRFISVNPSGSVLETAGTYSY